MKPNPELKKRILEDMLGKSYDAYVNFKKQPFLPKKRQHRQRIPLWRFILHLLHLDEHRIFIEWTPRSEMEFRIKDPVGVASLWGSIKDKADMTYEKLGRAMRYYYGKSIIEKVAGKRYSYRFILSRKTKKYIDEFSRKPSISSSGSVESDEVSSMSEDQSDLDIKEEECTSPDSGCTESSSESFDSLSMPNFSLDDAIPSDILDISWHDLIGAEKNLSSVYSVQNVNQTLDFMDTYSVPDTQETGESKALSQNNAVLPPDSHFQTYQQDILFDIKPLSDLLFQPDNVTCQNIQYFWD